MKKIILLILFFFTQVNFSHAASCTADGDNWAVDTDVLTAAEVQTCIDNADAGDTITFDAGARTWTTGITISKNIILVGAGTGCPSACDNATIITHGSTTDGLIAISATNNPVVDISGFTFDGGSNVDYAAISITNTSHTAVYNNFRIHNNAFQHFGTSTYAAAIDTTGYVYGLFDNNYFHSNKVDIRFFGDRYSEWGRWAKESGGTNKLEFSTLGMGSSAFAFVEDNVIDNNRYRSISSGAGSRVVYRYNTITAGSASVMVSVMDFHGVPSNGGNVAGELYHNTIDGTGSPYTVPALAQYRGGTALIFDNTITGDAHPYDLWVSNVDRVNAGYDCDDTYTYSNTTNNMIHNGYLFRNTSDGDRITISQAEYDTLDCLTSGTDYWSDTKDETTSAQDAYTWTSSTTAPATCTAGAKFWDTDYEKGDGYSTGGLYSCDSENTWTWIYSPYQYPHPGQSGTSVISTGTVIPGAINEDPDITDNGFTLTITISDATWDTLDDTKRDAIVNAFDSAQAEAAGWDAKKATWLVAGGNPATLTRVSDTVMTVAIPATSTYSITADEVVTLTIPASVISGTDTIVCTSFTITNNTSGISNVSASAKSSSLGSIGKGTDKGMTLK